MRHKTKQQRKEFKRKQARDVFYIVFCTLIIAGMGYHFHHQPKLLSPIALVQAEQVVTPTASAPLLAVYDSNKEPTQDEIESYIRRIFTDNADTAIAISHHECSPQNKTYPNCIANTQYEYSVGVFQINLYNKEQRVHADRIPGTTMEEKIEWLKNPFNNTLYAWWVYSTSGFTPWSTYTSGAYLN